MEFCVIIITIEFPGSIANCLCKENCLHFKLNSNTNINQHLVFIILNCILTTICNTRNLHVSS